MGDPPTDDPDDDSERVDDAPTQPRPASYAPHAARRRALEALFEADARGEAPSAVLRRVHDTPGASSVDPLARALVEGVEANQGELDELLNRYARNWTVSRMPAVDRTLLRMALYELLHVDTPPAVVIDEAVELVKLLSTDRSPRFVNGILEAIRRDLVSRDRESAD